MANFFKTKSNFLTSIITIVLAVPLSVIGTILYVLYFNVNHPNIRYEIISSASVVDLKEKLGNLEIIYDNIDIIKSNQLLRMIVLKVQNDGAKSVSRESYDPDHLLGLSISSGKILDIKLLNASNQYIKEGMHFTQIENGKVLFPQIILEPNDFFTIKILTLGKNSVSPSITTIGKILGQKEILVSDLSNLDSQTTIWDNATTGPVLVQLIRALVYFLGFILLIMGISATIVLIFFPFITFKEYRQKKHRKADIEEFKRSFGSTEANYIPIFELYINDGFHYLLYIEKLISKPAMIPLALKEGRGIRASSENMSYSTQIDALVKMLKDNNLIKKSNHVYSCNRKFKIMLKSLIEFTKNRGRNPNNLEASIESDAEATVHRIISSERA